MRNESHIELVDATQALQHHQEVRSAIKARSRSLASANRHEKATSLVETEENSRAIAKAISGSGHNKQVLESFLYLYVMSTVHFEFLFTEGGEEEDLDQGGG